MNRRAFLVAGIGVLLGLPLAAHAQQWVTPATISPTAPLSAGRVCYTDGRDIACDASAPLLSALGSGTSDRITSGTTGLTAISNTKTISITTNNVVTGYFNSNGVLTVPGISTTSNLTSVTTLTASKLVQLNGGLLFNQGPLATDNLMYVGSTSAGKVDASFGFFMGGVGSSNAVDGPYFLARGNNFSGMSNQRGNIMFVAGTVSSPAAAEGSIQFWSNGEQRVMIVDNAGNVGIGIGAALAQAKLEVQGTVSATNVYATAGTGTVSGTNVYASSVSGTTGTFGSITVGSCTGCGGGTGDRITSGTLLAVANSATGYISLTTGVTNWGYLSSGASYIPTLSSNFVSSTSISASTAYVKNTMMVSGSTYVSDLTIMGSASGAGLNPTVSVSASGADTQVQYNSSGSLAGSSNFTYSAGLLTLTGTVSGTNVYASSVSGTTGTFGSITVGSCTGCGGGGGSGDRITSGTTGITAISNTKTISITTNNVVTGYFNSNGVLTVPGISTTSNLTSVTTLYASGKVGIGLTNPNAPLEVKGIVSSTGVNVTGDISYTGVLTDTSDRRLKHDIKPLPFNSALDKLMLMKPVQFRMNDRPDRVEWGFVAQDVEQIFSNLVFTANDTLGTKTLNYIGMIAPMVQGMQEEHRQVAALRDEVEQLKAQVRILTELAKVKTTGSQADDTCTSADVGAMRRNPKTNRLEVCH